MNRNYGNYMWEVGTLLKTIANVVYVYVGMLQKTHPMILTAFKNADINSIKNISLLISILYRMLHYIDC